MVSNVDHQQIAILHYVVMMPLLRICNMTILKSIYVTIIYKSLMQLDNNYNMVMRTSLWGSLMAGAAGASWYFGGLDAPNNDMAAEDFRARDRWWSISTYAKKFFKDHLPFWEMRLLCCWSKR